jgi:hypothetical protein
MFVGYDSFCGLPVYVRSTTQTAEATFDERGRPIIIIDPGVYGNWTASRIFVIAHECAHHINGHTSSAGMMRRFHGNGTAAQERGADCWAAEQLAQIGLIDEIERALFDFANAPTQPFWSPYPSGRERAGVVYGCANRAGANLRPYGEIIGDAGSGRGPSSQEDDPCAPENRERYFFIVCLD